ncbi:MAG: sugar ABC transporter permease [Ruminococcus sp.]|nr:sugar ABC transporter permease [Ruminococcus sp.]
MASTAQSRIKSVSYAKYGYIFILPFFLVYCFFQIWPLINTILLSFQGNGSATGEWVGLDNYSTILFGGDGGRSASTLSEDFWHSLYNTIILWVGNFIPQILLSLLLAVWFTDSKLHIPGKGFFKVVMYLPNIITAVSVAALYLCLISNQATSAINTLIMNDGKNSQYAFEGITGTFAFFDTSIVSWSRGIVMFIQTWMWFGNTMIMMMSGILGINPSLFEAASIDGASSGQTLTKITLPLLSPMVVYTLITSMIGGLQMFDIPYLFHSSSTAVNENLRTIAIYIYDSFHVSNQNSIKYGIAGAASVILFIITAILGILIFRINRDEDEHRKKKERKALIKENKAKLKVEKQGGIS